MTTNVLVHAKEVAAWSTDSDDVRYCQSVIVALVNRLAAAERVVEAAEAFGNKKFSAHARGLDVIEAYVPLADAIASYRKAYTAEPKHTRWSDIKAKRKATDLNFSQSFPVDGVPKCVRQLVGPSGYIEAYCMLPKGHSGKHSPKTEDARTGKPE